jgi:hypothetical protein
VTTTGDTTAKEGRASAPQGTRYGGDQEQARRGGVVVGDVYEDLAKAAREGVAATDVAVTDTLEAADDSEALARLCDLMSKRAQRQTVVYAERSAGLADVDWTCERATGLLLRRARQTGGLQRALRPTLIGVNAQGDRATATLRLRDGGPASTVSLVKEDGEWKLAATPGS